MKKKVLYHIQQYPGPFSILTDESTSSSGIACLIIYLHYTSNDFPINIFADLLELNATNASEIANQILNCLHRHGFSNSYLSDNILGFCSDGASVMIGSNTGTQSSKNKRELSATAVEEEVCLLKIGRVLNTRWVASSF